LASAASVRISSDKKSVQGLGGIDTCDGDRHLNSEAGGQEHTQWLARVLALPVLAQLCNYCDHRREQTPP
jgi:hypothetical protein